MYYHEQQERKISKYPMNTEWPVEALDADRGMEYLNIRRLSTLAAIKNGWYVSQNAGDDYERIVIPAITHKAGHVYWQARDITGNAWLRYQSPKGPRYEAFIAVKPVYPSLGVVVVEGPMDALAAAGELYTGIALMGMVPSKDTIIRVGLYISGLKKMNTLVVMDKGEVANSTRIATMLASYGIPARVAELPTKDLAACLPQQRRKFLSQKFSSLFKQKNSPKPRSKGKRV